MAAVASHNSIIFGYEYTIFIRFKIAIIIHSQNLQAFKKISLYLTLKVINGIEYTIIQ
jgi:hypothetical protein